MGEERKKKQAQSALSFEKRRDSTTKKEQKTESQGVS